MKFLASIKHLQKALVLSAFVFLLQNNGWGQATLPVTRTAWGTAPTGWTDAAGTPYNTTFACSGSDGGKFDASAQTVSVFFNSAPNQLSFTVKSNSAASTSVLLVEESPDGASYTTVVSLTGTAGLPTTCTARGPYSLLSASRYVRWSFTKGTSNMTWDDVSITIPTCTPPADPSGTITPTANPACTSTTLTYSAPNANLYWQTTAGGTSTANPTTSALTVSSSGTYYVRAYDGSSCWSTGTVNSGAITINTPPAITVHPSIATPTVCSGSALSALSVTATGTGLTYQWYINSSSSNSGGASIGGATSASYTPSNTLVGTTYYYCVVTGTSPCTTATSNVSGAITVNAAPANPIGSITPASDPSCVSTTLNYSASAANFYWQTTAGGTSTANPTTADLTVSSSGTYYVRNYNGSCWSTGNVASAAITIINVPSAPVSSAASLITPTSFSANWAASATATTYYLDVCTDAGFTAFVSGYNNLNVGNVTTYSVTGLSSNVTYYYRVRASNACGTSGNSLSKNTTTSKSATSDIISAGGTAVSIPSTENSVSPLTSSTGVQVWQITVRDGGASSPDADNLPTILTAFTIAQVSNTVTNWSQAIKTIELFDGATNIGIATVTSTQIQFTGLNVTVADNSTKILSLRLSLNCGIGAANFDADRFGFSVTSANTTFSTAGSSKDAFIAAQAGGVGINAIDVVATQLIFSQQPTNTGTAETMTPSVTIAAADACGNKDINFSGTVSVTSSGTATVSPITATFTSGLATITPIIHTVAETGVVLTASCPGLDTAWSASFEIYPYVGIPDNGCATSTYATSIINYPTDYIITDVNVGVKISHTFRGDLNVSLVSPSGTTVLLIASVGGSAANLDGIIDDQASANQFSIVSNHVIDGVYDVNGKPEGALTGLLSTFNGENSLGNWTLKICDDAGADIGGVISWELFITGTSPCTFSAGAITGAPYTINCASGTSGSVAYSSTCTFSGNTFTAQLSNSSGSFASPTTIGTLVSDANTGSININIPSTLTTGAGYLIRILSSNPAYTSVSSGAFTITNSAPCTITPGAVTGAPFAVNCATPASGSVSFTSTATYSGNTYTVQLSDAAGSFSSPTNIGSLVSNANSGSINFTIPAGVPTGSGYLIRIISNSPSIVGSSSSSFTINLGGGPCQAFEIQSILIDACGNPEGGNEMVRFQVGGSPLNTSNITVAWPNTANTWRGICQNSSTAATIAAINATITAGGMLIEPTGGVLPANAQVMFFTSTSFAAGLYDFSNLNYNLYAIFQCSGNTAGHFVNSSGTNPTNRTLTITFTGYGSDVVTYNAYNVYNGDGGSVEFTPAGVPTYGSTGGCIAPIFSLPIKLLSFNASLNVDKVNLNWITTSEINNDYFTVERSADAINFEPILTKSGAGNSSTTLYYRDVDQSPITGVSYYRLKQTDFDGNYSYSNLATVKIENKEGFQIINTFGSIETGAINITINCGANCMVNFELFDMTGKMVRSVSQNINDINTTYSIPTKGLSEGIYLIKAFNGDKVITKKIKL